MGKPLNKGEALNTSPRHGVNSTATESRMFGKKPTRPSGAMKNTPDGGPFGDPNPSSGARPAPQPQTGCAGAT